MIFWTRRAATALLQASRRLKTRAALVPPNPKELDPAFADMPIVRKRIDDAKLSHVLSNSFGFGGTNAALVFKRLDA